uniref:dATP/dGTP diphosphohydrolase N-terminal domain-containing protein n=1 Tax=viral metagenome TaxID=1070528 RepID=A0A6H1ZF24_9ZZZZ
MKEYTDQCFEQFGWIVGSIQNENERQLLKWGIQTHSPFEWLTYTTEELGELAQAILEHEYRDGTKEAVVKEAIQVATLALKIAEMFH